MNRDQLEALRDGTLPLTRSRAAVVIQALLEVMDECGVAPAHESQAWKLAYLTRNRSIAARIENAVLP